jgi:hypothetical protein
LRAGTVAGTEFVGLWYFTLTMYGKCKTLTVKYDMKMYHLYNHQNPAITYPQSSSSMKGTVAQFMQKC